MRVLIPTVTAGAGHLQAAAALEEAWRSLHPNDELRRVDVLDYVPRWYRKIYVKGYVKLIEHAPELYAMMFKKTDNPSRIKELTKFRRQSSGVMASRFVKELVAFQPEVMIAPHYLPLEILGGVLTRRRYRGKVSPHVTCVVTDFEAHALWMEPCVNLYCVASEATKARLVARGAPGENVIVTGIPIAAKFAARPNTDAIRKQFSFSKDVQTLLVLGGGFGMGPVQEILGELNRIAPPLQVIVVCGRNEKLRQQLQKQTHKHATQILGFATNMQELMAISDLILTKPGGLTTSEALAMGKPLLILHPIPGQEAANSDFLLEQGAAAKVNCLEDLPYKLKVMLEPRKLAQMSRVAKALGQPQSATAICSSIIKSLPMQA